MKRDASESKVSWQARQLKQRSWRITLTAAVTFASGLMTLYSLISRTPAQRRRLQEVFPLDFIHLSRFVTVILGFALVVSSINIYRRKKRAFYITCGLALLSIALHLIPQGGTRSMTDYTSAALSALLLVVIVSARRYFTVKSSLPDVRDAAVRVALAVGFALVYGIAGFFYLDVREFGINFTLLDSIRRTLLFYSLVGDPQIVPHTRYAAWFLDSLSMIGAMALLYSLFALFRPVLYRYATLPYERIEVKKIVERFGRSAQDYFKTWEDKSYFFSPARSSVIAYRVGGNFAVTLGDPVGPETEISDLVRDFMTMCDQNGWSFAFHQALPDFLPMYRRLGLKILKIGDDAIIELDKFSLNGKSAKKFRHTINLLEREGFGVRYYEAPISDDVLRKVKAVSDEWLQIPGRRERTFTLGQFIPSYVRSTPLFVVERDEEILAFVNILPSPRKDETTIDLMRRTLDAPPGVMDYLIVKFCLFSRAWGFARFNLGMAPMSGFTSTEDATVEEKAVHYFFQRLNFLFNFRGLRDYKAKFATLWEPRFGVFRGVRNLPEYALAVWKVSTFEEGGE